MATLPEKEYIPKDKRENYAYQLEYAYSIWYGDRDLAYLYSDAKLMVGLDADELHADIYEMEDWDIERERLIKRIRTSNSKVYPNRTSVRKKVWRSFMVQAQQFGNIYQNWKAQIDPSPGEWGKQFDSIKGYIEWRNRQ